MPTTMGTTRTRGFHPEQAAGLPVPPRPGWDLETERRMDDGRTLANGLGWFSIGLGLAELFVPEQLGRYLGMEDRTELIRAYGLREIATGVGILQGRRPAGWVWARVAGDALDLATLASGLTPDNDRRDNVLTAVAAVVGVAALDVIAARRLSQDRHQH